LASRAELEVATVDPEHNRFASSRCRCIDVEIQTVLAFTGVTASGEHTDCKVPGGLRICASKSVCTFQNDLVGANEQNPREGRCDSVWDEGKAHV
jgi:hypothetical protein